MHDPYIPPQPEGLSSENRNYAMAAHLSGLVGLISIPSVVGPLVVYLMRKDGHPFEVRHAKEALNFQLSALLYFVVGGIVAAVFGILTVGLALFLIIPLALASGIAWLVLTIVAGIRASGGEEWNYPFTIRFVN